MRPSHPPHDELAPKTMAQITRTTTGALVNLCQLGRIDPASQRPMAVARTIPAKTAFSVDMSPPNTQACCAAFPRLPRGIPRHNFRLQPSILNKQHDAGYYYYCSSPRLILVTREVLLTTPSPKQQTSQPKKQQGGDLCMADINQHDQTPSRTNTPICICFCQISMASTEKG